MRTIYIQNPDGTLTEVQYDETTGQYSGSSVIDDPRLATVAQYPELVSVTKPDFAGNSTQTSIEEVYNQLVLTCELEELEDVVDSPTDDDTMYSPFASKQKYCEEYCAWGGGVDSVVDAYQWITNHTTTWSNAEIYTHYIQVYKSNAWTFSGDQYISEDGTNQDNVLFQAKKKRGVAFLCAFGHTSPKSNKDNSIDAKLDMTKYLCISINGSGTATESDDYDDDEGDDPNSVHPNDSEVKAMPSPIAVYTANKAGGWLSPTDSSTTNYLVIQGKMFVESTFRKHSQNRFNETGQQLDYPLAKTIVAQTIPLALFGGGWGRVHLDNGKDGGGAIYSTRFYKCATPQSTPQCVETTGNEGLYPRMSSWDKEEMGHLKYGWSANGDETDLIHKIPLIQCTLKVGDKYCCEMYDDSGQAYFEWHTLDDPSMPYDTYQGEKQPRNHIYIGYDPAIDDYIIGAKEYDIANSVYPEYNIDEEGMCIPIKASDELSGKVEFQIDGVCNLTFEKILRRHPSFWRSTKWYHNVKYVLAHINTIFIKDFEIKVYSDQAGINNIPDDRDLIYMTDELDNEKYINKMDDISFKINTALTTEECQEKSVRQSVKMSNPYIGKEPLRSVYNTVTGNQGKPEELYLTDYWPEYNTPKMLLETTLHATDENDWITQYKFNAFPGKIYMVQADEYDVKAGHHSLTLKEL